ncbi:MAG: sugar phosphate isomerase/epimerase family protein [Pontiella sp.]
MKTKNNKISRRHMLQVAAGTTATMGLADVEEANGQELIKQRSSSKKAIKNGRLKQSVCHWCFTSDCSVQPMSLDRLAGESAAMGLKSIELVDPEHWGTLKKHGLICAMAGSHGFVKGFNDKNNHAMCIDKIKKAIDACADAGYPNVITFSGFRNNIPDDVGLENTVEGLKKVIGYAEKKKINLVMEVLNSRVDIPMKGHPGYMGDTVEWVGEVCKRISSPRMLMLFDIYHVQIMQGDIITRIRKWKDYIGHYHVAGVPGRNEMDDNQEVNYPAIMREIVKTGFTGYVGQEFIPTREPLRELYKAVQLCDV